MAGMAAVASKIVRIVENRLCASRFSFYPKSPQRSWGVRLLVPSARIELASPPSEGGILSIERRGRFSVVDLPGIEPGIQLCHSCVLPLYYRPILLHRW